MRTWVADLTGLAIGFALGGAALVHFLPRIEAVRGPVAAIVAAAMRPSPPAPVAVTARPPLPRIVTPGAPPAPLPAPLPDPALPEAEAAMPPPAPLPEVVEPGDPDPVQPRPTRGTGSAGTGFFVADGLVLTAAHVVPACRKAEIVSPFVRRTLVTVAARDTRHDIALLRAGGVRAPATLAIGRPTGGGARVFILGYPASAGLLRPEETWGVLENDKLPRQPATLTDPRQQVWMEAGKVTHGYSGGPIFDPDAGKVVGIVRAGLQPGRLRSIRGMPESGLAIGPGSALLNGFLADAAPGTDDFPADQWGDDPLTVARHATVHVFCWH
jgi:S1-C subfamily serine protease